MTDAGRKVFATCAAGLPYGLIDGAAPDLEAGRILRVGKRRALPSRHASRPLTDFGAHSATPASVDCHTHIKFGGHQLHGFEVRLTGTTCGEIALAGDGIRSTVRATRRASEEPLIAVGRGSPGLECATPGLGTCADIVAWDAESPAELACPIGFNLLARHLRGLSAGSNGDTQ